MISVIILVLCVILALLIRILRSLYVETPLELKNRARSGDMLSAQTYKVISRYGTKTHALLVFLILLFTSSVGAISGRYYSPLGSVSILVFAYSMTAFFGFFGPQSIVVLSKTAFVIEYILRFTSPLLKYPAHLIEKYFHTGPDKKISSKEELIRMIDDYTAQSRLSIQERKTVHGGLTYADKKVADFMIPNSVIVSIKSDEELSPVVIGELHDSGHSRFPVLDDKGNAVGTLFIKDAINNKNNKKVSDLMRSEVYYLNEEQNLQDALKAFLKTKHHLFMVVNEYEDIVGLITIEDVLEQIIGEKIIDEFDQYDDLKMMATAIAQRKREERA